MGTIGTGINIIGENLNHLRSANDIVVLITLQQYSKKIVKTNKAKIPFLSHIIVSRYIPVGDAEIDQVLRVFLKNGSGKGGAALGNPKKSSIPMCKVFIQWLLSVMMSEPKSTKKGVRKIGVTKNAMKRSMLEIFLVNRMAVFPGGLYQQT